MTSDESAAGGCPAPSAMNQLENIKVAVRLRPFTEKEKQRNSQRIVDIEQNTVALYNLKYGETSSKKFTFDYSYWSHDGFQRDASGVNIPDSEHPNSAKYVGQEKVFEDLGRFLLANALQGYNSALLAYGQTGSGKSYTVSGYGQNAGILPRFARALFEELDKKAKVLERPQGDAVEPGEGATAEAGDVKVPDTESPSGTTEKEDEVTNNRYEVFFSMIEIYNEVVRDLLAKSRGLQAAIARRGLKVREHPKRGFFVEELTSYACKNKDEIEQKIEEGQLNKSIAATSMNEVSSRGHTIYEFRIKQYKLKSPENPEETLITSVVQLVDLAGSERMAVHVSGQNGLDNLTVASRSNSPFSRGANERVSNAKSTRSTTRAPASASSVASSVYQSSNQMRSTNMSLYNNQQHQRFKESVSINQSLSALGNCIQVLSQYSQQMDSSSSNVKRQRPKIPYRDSVLTKLLNKCCLSGNSKVVIIATLSPSDANYDDTLSTLRFADRAKQIRTHATINCMSRGQIVNALKKENDRLKQMIDGRVTRSDDSSQTSNFDDSENMMENFSGPRIRGTTKNVDAVATPTRSRTIKKSGAKRDGGKAQTKNDTKLGSASSNPSLVVEDRMKRLVSPASKTMVNSQGDGKMHKSRSMGYGLAGENYKPEDGDEDNPEDELIGEVDINDLAEVGLIDERELGDIKEGLMSSDSEDSFGAIEVEGLSNDEKISLFNKLLSHSKVMTKMDRATGSSRNKLPRPKKTGRVKQEVNHVSVLSSSLKKTNPYLSNLNPDEQLTGVISYIIKAGETLIGKGGDCDIILHGPELQSKHAKITRAEEQGKEKSVYKVFIEPVAEAADKTDGQERTPVALMVNGSRVDEKTRLKHCDRLLFGSNIYFVYIDNVDAANSSGETVADPDMVTYEMARNEVLRKVMSEAKNEAMIKEINEYTHRPGTGKYKNKPEESKGNDKEKVVENSSSSPPKGKGLKLTRSITIHDADQEDVKSTSQGDQRLHKPVEKIQERNKEEVEDDSKTDYREKLMEDTYEFAMPVAEANAVAKEMGIKVNYGLKILTGEEQLPEQMDGYLDSNASDGFSSSSQGEENRTASGKSQANDDRVTILRKVDSLDVPPALFVHVHLEESKIDFYWSKEKFQARRYKILELYGAWDVGGKPGLVEHLIDQSRNPGDFLFDPFVDNPATTLVLIGHAQVTLQPISHLSDIDQSFDVLNLNDEIVGNITIQAIPCHAEKLRDGEGQNGSQLYRPYEEKDLSTNLLDQPEELLDKKLVFLLKILSCRDLPDHFTNVFCQYTLNRDRRTIRTDILRDGSIESENGDDSGGELSFNHTHYICFERVDRDILDFLQHGFLTLQVVGQYKLGERTNKSPTVISTIINSINKYKYKLDQHSAYNYSSSTYDNSNTDSAKSHRGPSSGMMNSNSGASSVVSTSATVNLFDQQNEEDEGINSINGLSQENIIDMILTKRKLDRAENQLHYLKRTINIAEHYNKKHIPVKTVKKLLNSYGHELDGGSLEEMAADVTDKRTTGSKNSGCSVM